MSFDVVGPLFATLTIHVGRSLRLPFRHLRVVLVALAWTACSSGVGRQSNPPSDNGLPTSTPLSLRSTPSSRTTPVSSPVPSKKPVGTSGLPDPCSLTTAAEIRAAYGGAVKPLGPNPQVGRLPSVSAIAEHDCFWYLTTADALTPQFRIALTHDGNLAKQLSDGMRASHTLSAGIGTISFKTTEYNDSRKLPGHFDEYIFIHGDDILIVEGCDRSLDPSRGVSLSACATAATDLAPKIYSQIW